MNGFPAGLRGKRHMDFCSCAFVKVVMFGHKDGKNQESEHGEKIYSSRKTDF